MRFESVLAIWLDCDTAELDERTDVRVEEMMSRGALEEVEVLFDSLRAQGVDRMFKYVLTGVLLDEYVYWFWLIALREWTVCFIMY